MKRKNVCLYEENSRTGRNSFGWRGCVCAYVLIDTSITRPIHYIMHGVARPGAGGDRRRDGGAGVGKGRVYSVSRIMRLR